MPASHAAVPAPAGRSAQVGSRGLPALHMHTLQQALAYWVEYLRKCCSGGRHLGSRAFGSVLQKELGGSVGIWGTCCNRGRHLAPRALGHMLRCGAIASSPSVLQFTRLLSWTRAFCMVAHPPRTTAWGHTSVSCSPCSLPFAHTDPSFISPRTHLTPSAHVEASSPSACSFSRRLPHTSLFTPAFHPAGTSSLRTSSSHNAATRQTSSSPPVSVHTSHPDASCRDIKPENLLFSDFSDTADVKLADFGLSTMLGDELLHDPVGSTYYVAPEVLWLCGGAEERLDGSRVADY
eukprot:365834-Chlamydomonas_euryale.AAC.6